MFEKGNILEIVYSVGSLDKVCNFFCDYGGWNTVGSYNTNRAIMDFWDLDASANANEVLIQSNHHNLGQIRLIKYDNVVQDHIRSSQQPWDVGGIMDINLRVHDVAESFHELREMGWHGLSDPLFQTMGPFQLHDILMRGYDDIIIAFTHSVKPPLNLQKGLKLPSHVYTSSITVDDIEASRVFYRDILGFSLLNQYEVKKDTPQENMFGLPFNMANQIPVEGNIFSPDGTRATAFQIVKFPGLSGKNFTAQAKPPNRGLLLYRCEVKGLQAFYDDVISKNAKIYKPITSLPVEPYGEVRCFSIVSPVGVIWEFLERK